MKILRIGRLKQCVGWATVWVMLPERRNVRCTIRCRIVSDESAAAT